MSVSLPLGLVYLISDSGLQKNLIGKPGIQESRKGIAEIEGKATRVGASSAGNERVSIAADLFDKLKAGSAAPLALTVFCKWSVA